MDVSAIIVNRNTRDMLCACLRSLEAASKGVACETWVVDNGSTDGSQSLVREQYPQIHLIENEENLGFSRANNQAILQSSGPYILLLNTDAFLSSQGLSTMKEFMESHPEAGLLGVELVYPDGRKQSTSGALPTPLSETLTLFGLDRLGRPARKESGSFFETGFVSGACLMARRSMVEQVGPLDDSFFFFSEDIDWCFRAHCAGWRVYQLTSMNVVHKVGGTTGDNAERILLLYKGKIHYMSKHYGPWWARSLKAAMWSATLCKVLGYALEELGTHRAPSRKDLWWAVARGLSQL